MFRIKRVVGIYPSTSGNTRVAIEFHDRGDLNFYMTKDGRLHLGKTHDEHTLDDPRDAYKEFKWAQEQWKKGNPDVVTEDLTGERLQMAVALCNKLTSPTERPKVIRQALDAKASRPKLGQSGKFKEVFKEVKKKIKNNNKNSSEPANTSATTNHKLQQAAQPVTTMEPGKEEQKVSYGDKSPMDKFKARYPKYQKSA